MKSFMDPPLKREDVREFLAWLLGRLGPLADEEDVYRVLAADSRPDDDPDERGEFDEERLECVRGVADSGPQALLDMAGAQATASLVRSVLWQAQDFAEAHGLLDDGERREGSGRGEPRNVLEFEPGLSPQRKRAKGAPEGGAA